MKLNLLPKPKKARSQNRTTVITISMPTGLLQELDLQVNVFTAGGGNRTAWIVDAIRQRMEREALTAESEGVIHV